MSSQDSLKLLLVPASEEEVLDSVMIANKIAGMEYPSLSSNSDESCSTLTSLFKQPSSLESTPLRILDMTINHIDIEVWNVFGIEEYKETHIPTLCLMESCGLMIVSDSPPVPFLERHNAFFSSIDFPILWFMNKSKISGSQEQKRAVIQKEASLSPLNVTKVTYTSPDETIIQAEFSHWLMKVHSYVTGSRM